MRNEEKRRGREKKGQLAMGPTLDRTEKKGQLAMSPHIGPTSSAHGHPCRSGFAGCYIQPPF
jgi:hypothetical protein